MTDHLSSDNDRSNGKNDEGEDERPSTSRPSIIRLGWLPNYDEELINQVLQRLWNEVWWALNYGLWWVILSAVVFVLYEQILGITLMAPLLMFTPWLWRQGQKIFVLECRRRAAASTKGKERR